MTKDRIGNLYMNKDGEFFRIVPVLAKSAQADADGNDIRTTYATKDELTEAIGGAGSSIGDLEQALAGLTEVSASKQDIIPVGGSEGEFTAVPVTGVTAPGASYVPVTGDSVIDGSVTVRGTVSAGMLEGPTAPLARVCSDADTDGWRKAVEIVTPGRTYCLMDFSVVCRSSPLGYGRLGLACYSDPDPARTTNCRASVMGLDPDTFRIAKNGDGNWEIWCRKAKTDLELVHAHRADSCICMGRADIVGTVDPSTGAKRGLVHTGPGGTYISSSTASEPEAGRNGYVASTVPTALSMFWS